MKLKECKSKEEKLQELKARAKAKGDNIKGFHNLFLAIYEKFDFDDREALRKTSEAITHGISYFTLRDETLKEKIKILKNQKYFIESVIPLIGNQLKKVNNFDDLLSYVFTGDFMEMSKDVISFICKSEEETEEQKANEESITGESSKATVEAEAEIKSDKPKTRSEAKKQADKKYRESDRGKTTNKKYRESEKGRATRANYLQSEAGKQARAKANRKYRESEKGQQTQKQAYNKYLQSDKGKQARLKAVKAYRERQKINKGNI
jgi:hypothetical protein